MTLIKMPLPIIDPEVLSAPYLLSRAGYGFFGLRKGLQGLVNYIRYAAPYLHKPQHHQIACQYVPLLTHFELGLFGGYALIFAVCAIVRLIDLWMEQGQYQDHPKTWDKKIHSTVFGCARILADLACFISTALIATDVITITHPFAISVLVFNNTITLFKYSTKMIRLMMNHTHLPNTPNSPNEGLYHYKRAHYAIHITMAAVLIPAMILFFTVSAPFNTAIYTGCILLWTGAKLAYDHWGKKKLKCHFMPNAQSHTEEIELQSLSKPLADSMTSVWQEHTKLHTHSLQKTRERRLMSC